MQKLNVHQDGEHQNGDQDKNPIDLSQYPMSNLTDAQKVHDRIYVE